MIRYIVNQTNVERQIKRECTYLTVLDGAGRPYNIRVDRQGKIEVSSVGDDLKVVCKTSNSLTVGIDE